MEWADHVAAFHSTWILKYYHPSKAKWKLVLDEMLFKDTKGSDVFGAGRGVLLTHMTPREKITMLGMLPRKAYHIKSCLRAFWKLELTSMWTRRFPLWLSPCGVTVGSSLTSPPSFEATL